MAGSADVDLRDTPQGVRLTVKVVPGASRDRLVGALGRALKLAVAAPPEGGKANTAVCKLLAHSLKVKVADVTIVSGHAQPLKHLLVHGLTAADVRQRLALD
ncbi:MAG: DUF167 domain-containing protein [Planctomycetota bacterium]